MRHRVAGRKLGRTTAHREAMMRNLAVALIQHGRIQTTLHKAKELRPFADHLVTLGKKNTLHAKRLAFNRLRDREAVLHLFDHIAPAFSGRNGGYTRIYQLARSRPGDTADVALIEYLAEDVLKKTAEKIRVKKTKTEKKEKDIATAKTPEQAKDKPAKKAKEPKTKSPATKKKSLKTV